MVTTEIVHEIDTRLEVVRDEIGRLEAAREILVPAPSTNGASTRPRRTRRRSRKNGAITEGTIIAAIGKGHDQATSIAQEFGASVNVVRARLAQLEAAGTLRHEGERSQRRWMAA